MGKVKYIIYQPTVESGLTHRFFNDLDIAGGNIRFDFDFYNKVYAGIIDVEDTELVSDVLERIFRKFQGQEDTPYDFKGYNMRSGDIVALEDNYFYCDTTGWSRNITDECIGG